MYAVLTTCAFALASYIELRERRATFGGSKDIDGDILMRIQNLLGCSFLVGSVLFVGCAAPMDEDSAPRPLVNVEPAAKGGTQAPMLNLSHIECLEDGTVNAHFVLLFWGKTNPGPLQGTYLDGDGVAHSFSGVDPTKNTGNVWHYNVSLPSGYIDITSATAAGVSLHNPDEYAGKYECGTTHQACAVEVQAQSPYCTDKALGNEGAECAEFGLEVLGKISQPDQGSWGTCFTVNSGAYVALVKTGSAACGSGNASYSVYVNVSAGDTLCTPEYTGNDGNPTRQGISHITLCSCPADKIVSQ
jgi:hypothetical protein